MHTTEKKRKYLYKALGFGLPMLLFTCFGLLSILPDLRPAVPEMLFLTALSTLIVAALFHGVRNGWGRWSPVTILIVAAALRLLFLFHAPQLSDDVHRYLFDGGRTLAGHNPYAFSPGQAARENSSLAPGVGMINHPHLITIYPPGAQVIFSVGALLKNITGMKLVLVLLDLICIALMMRLMSHMGIRHEQAILYAWHPLSVLEIASSGHIDGVALMFVFAAVCLLWPVTVPSHETPMVGRTSSGQGVQSAGNPVDVQKGDKLLTEGRQKRTALFWSGMLFSFAILIKLLPIVFLPLCFLLVQRDRRIFFITGLAVGSVLLILPFCPDIRNMIPTLGIYTATWEFSGLAFRSLRDGLQSGFRARIVLGIVFAAFWLYCYRTTARRKTGMVRSAEGLIADVLRALYAIAFVFLLLTPTLHPWYGLYMLAFLPFCPNPSGMILSWSITLGYRVLIPLSISNQWIEGGGVGWLIWIGPIAALLISWVINRSHRFNNVDDAVKV